MEQPITPVGAIIPTVQRAPGNSEYISNNRIPLFSDELEVFLPKYSQTAIRHAAHFRRVVNVHRTVK